MSERHIPKDFVASPDNLPVGTKLRRCYSDEHYVVIGHRLYRPKKGEAEWQPKVRRIEPSEHFILDPWLYEVVEETHGSE